MNQKLKSPFLLAFLAVNLLGWVAFIALGRSRADDPASASSPSAPVAPGKASTTTATIAMPPPVDVPPAKAGGASPAPAKPLPAMRFCGVRGESPAFGPVTVRLGFSAPVAVEKVADGLTVTPDLPFTMGEEWIYPGSDRSVPGSAPNNIALYGEFVPGGRYKIAISNDLTSKDGAKLAPGERSYDIFIPDRAPGARFLASGGRYLAPSGKMLLPFEAVNITNIEIAVERILPQNLLQFVMRENDRYTRWYGDREEENIEKLSRFIGKADYPVRIPVNKPMQLTCDLAKIPGVSRYGAYFVSGRLPGGHPIANKVICVTDLGLSAKLDQKAAYVWVTSLQKATSRANMKVAVFSDRNEIIGTADTGADGLVRIPLVEDQTPIAVIAQDQTNGDVSFLPLIDRMAVPVEERGDRYLKADGGCEAFVYTDRGICRPGEKVWCEAILRDASQTAPESFPVVFKLFGIRGDLLREVPAMADATGAAGAFLDLSDGFQLGTYRVELSTPGKKGKVLGQARFQVESITPPQIRVDLATLPERLDGAKNDSLEVMVTSAFLFGAPAVGLQASGRLAFQPVPFRSSRWPGYRFGDSTGAKATIPVQKVDGRLLDDEGKTSISFSLKDLPAATSPLRASIQATVLEPGGRPRSVFGSTLVDCRPWYLGLSGKEIFEPGSQVAFDWALVAPDGSLWTNGATLKATLVREEIDWVCEVDGRGRWIWSSSQRDVPVFEDRPVPVARPGKGRFTFPAPVASWHGYRLTLSDEKGNRSSVPFDVSGWGAGEAVDPAAYSKVELKPDRAVYQPGETASIRISAPFTGSLWLVIQGESVLQSRVVPLDRKEMTIRLPVTEALAPCAKISATVLRPVAPAALWAPHRASALASFSVRPQKKVLDVAIAAPVSILPASKLTVGLVVTNRATGPVEDGFVTVMAVDEALCLLTDLVTPSPLDHFFRERKGMIPYYDIFSDLMQVTDENLLGFRSHAGGDKAASWKVRVNPIKSRRFKPLSLVRADLPVRRGRAVAVFDIPEFAGQVRIMAVARTKEASGSSETRAFVRRTVGVQPDMARFLAPGDESDLTISLFNRSGRSEKVALSVRSAGPIEILSVPKPVELPAKSSKTVVVPVRALESIGNAEVRIETEAAGERFSQAIELPVRPAAAWETSCTPVVVPARRSVRLEPVRDVLSETVRQRLDLTSFPSVDFRPAIDYLSAYPYDCLEQTVSRAYPFLRFKALPADVLPGGEGYDADSRIKAAIADLALMRRGNHGFSMWSDYLPVHCGNSLYAIRFLAEAIRAGYDTGEMTAGLLDEMTTRLHSWAISDECEVALCHALLDRPDMALLARLAAKPDLTTGQLATLGLAYLYAGSPAEGRGLLERAGKPVSFQSATTLLEAWTLIDPKSPRCAESLARIEKEKSSRSGHWETTWANAAASRAGLASLAATGAFRTDGTVRAKVQVELAGKKDTLVIPAGKRQVSVSEKRNGALVVINAATNDLYILRTVSAVPMAKARPAAQSRLGVTRSYFTMDGQAADLASVARGDNIVVELAVTPTETTDDLVIEDLLPACLEVESEDLASLNTFPWICYRGPKAIHAEARDDRVVVFPEQVKKGDTFRWYYLARVVSAGTFVVPAVRAEAMYKPEVFARGEESTLRVVRK